jgi:hypothetical protein
MKKHLNKITESGLDPMNLSKALAKIVKEYNKGEKELNTLKAKFEASQDEEEKKALKADIEEYEEILEATDDEICSKVDGYLKNKEMYEARALLMEKGRMEAAKARGQEYVPYGRKPKTAPAPAPVAVAPAAAPVVEEVQTPQVVPATEMPEGGQVHKAQIVEEKKGGGDWLFWGIVGTIGLFVGVNLFKNRN